MNIYDEYDMYDDEDGHQPYNPENGLDWYPNLVDRSENNEYDRPHASYPELPDPGTDRNGYRKG